MADGERVTAIDSEAVHFIDYAKAEQIERRLRQRLASAANGLLESSAQTETEFVDNSIEVR